MSFSYRGSPRPRPSMCLHVDSHLLRHQCVSMISYTLVDCNNIKLIMHTLNARTETLYRQCHEHTQATTNYTHEGYKCRSQSIYLPQE